MHYILDLCERNKFTVEVSISIDAYSLMENDYLKQYDWT